MISIIQFGESSRGGAELINIKRAEVNLRRDFHSK